MSSQRRTPTLERLEGRALLAATTETFNGPSLNDLIQQANEGKVTAPAAIQRMEQALQSQLTSGPLADLQNGSVNGSGFVSEVQSLETSFEQNVDSQLLPAFPNVDKMIKLQGERVVADITALNQQNTVGLISSSTLQSDSQTAINSLTGGPVVAIGTPASVLLDQTTTFESDLKTLVASLSPTASPNLTLVQVSTTFTAEANAYEATMDSALLVTNATTASQIDTAITDLETAAGSIAQNGLSGAAAAAQAALTTFDTAVRKALASYKPFHL